LAIGSNVLGRDFCHPSSTRCSQGAGARRYVHARRAPELHARFGRGWLPNVLGNPLDTTIALELIFEGRARRCPSQGAGAPAAAFSSYAPRMDPAASSRRKTATPRFN
jgi:aminocarboxymuconate-semialdehyde decarboxylase